MKTYKVRCQWTVESVITVKAETQEKALDQAYDTETDQFPKPRYIDDTFQVIEVEVIK